MDLNQIVIELNELNLLGEVKRDGDSVYWIYDDMEEDQDVLWDVYCDDAKIIQEKGFEIANSWQDNDSCGFDIVLTKLNEQKSK